MLNCGTKELDLSRVHVMGVINLSAQSFFGGSTALNTADIIDRAAQMIADGATLIDVGAEPTNPAVMHHRDGVSVETELERVVSAVQTLRSRFDVVISVDTSQASVMREAIQCGANFINDVRALQFPHTLEVIAQAKVAICLMHMSDPGIESRAARLDNASNIISQIMTFLEQRLDACLSVGIARNRIVIDPGFGGGAFGKSTAQNLQLLKNLDAFSHFRLPILVGISRKLFIGDILNKSAEERLYGSIAAATIAVNKGASIIRTHDVAATVDSIKVCRAVADAAES